MFIGSPAEARQASPVWLEDLARRHPRGFTALLVLLVALVTLGFLFKTSYSTILYQGF